MELKLNRLRVDAGSGPGSRGGHVIGKTSSGKPIYASPGHAKHGGFTAEEHGEAAELHRTLGYKTKGFGADARSHFAAAKDHEEAGLNAAKGGRSNLLMKGDVGSGPGSKGVKVTAPKPPPIAQKLNRKVMKAEQEEDPEKKARLQAALKET